MREPDFANWFKQFEEFFHEIRDSHSPGEMEHNEKVCSAQKIFISLRNFSVFFDVMKGFVRKSGD